MTQSQEPPRPRVAIETHGCKLNQADTGALAAEFAAAGFEIVRDKGAVDVYVLNSCTVTHVADSKGRHALRSARRRHPEATIVATGCYAERSPDELRVMSEVDLVFGNREKTALVRHVLESAGEELVPCATGDDVQAIAPSAARTRAMIKIQEGCNQVCAYCIVPKVRGRERSIPPDDIVATIDDHVRRGYKEVVLTGTQLGSYGFDLPDMRLDLLIERILERCVMPRLRVSSLQAHEIDARLLALWRDTRLAPHFHLPLQSGSDAILRRMRRRYTSGRFLEAVALIRDSSPEAAITTDVIAGFPGESDADFESTYAVCEAADFASMHVFPYSSRPGTSAAHFADDTPPRVKSERVARLIALSKQREAAYAARFVGRQTRALWETRKAGAWTGRADNYLRVTTDDKRDLANKLTRARLIRVNGGALEAEAL